MPLSKFKILRVLVINGISRLCGKPEQLLHAHQVWLRDGREGYLKNGSRLYRGHWLQRGDEWLFTFSRWCKSRLPAYVTEVEFLDEHWGWCASLVLDADRKWIPQKFRTSRGRNQKTCVLCSSVLCEDRPDHYRTKPDVVVCDLCYDRFVSLRSLAFIPGVAASIEEEPYRDPVPMPTLELPELSCPAAN